MKIASTGYPILNIYQVFSSTVYKSPAGFSDILFMTQVTSYKIYDIGGVTVQHLVNYVFTVSNSGSEPVSSPGAVV